MNTLLRNLASLGQLRLSLLALSGGALLLVFFFGLRAIMQPEYVQLYGGLGPGAASNIVDTLEQEGIKVQLGDSGATVSVPKESIARARMALADKGLPGDGTPGWELFDESGGLGMNSFLQRVNRLRALEGELARSIQTIEGVSAARVHLVLPEREAFSRDRPEPTASVIVRGSASRSIGQRQARAIRALVASAVPDLSTNKVTVLSADGETILGETTDGAGDVSIQSVKVGIEERMAQSISQILSARVGAGNVRVQVNVDLETERRVIRQQSFDPAQRVVRSTETSGETREDRDLAAGEVGVNGNIPPELADGAPENGGTKNTSERTREVVNYEIGKTESEVVREPGEIRRVSVAVLVNGIYNVADNGGVDYQERPTEELARLEELIKSAVGFNAERGDSVSVDSLRFIDYSMDVGEPVGPGIGQLLSDNFASILRGLLALGLTGAVLALGVRPLMKQMGEIQVNQQLALAAEKQEAAKMLAGATGGDTAKVMQVGSEAGGNVTVEHNVTQAAPNTVHRFSPNRAHQELVNLASVQGGVQRGWIETVSNTIESQPEESLRVVKSWLAEEV
ncbi:flagellar basal-body MS-ring/collar protein FliF [Seohaeicola zhoushanensis]|uniref:Flagellar M-ring protein n=1 Tax=Seohaeicola zhoushanensis TaxID=1569283 RepID=A0A8J3GUP9_9RHOB|nr:flagellar basal-body MS-ring/collar protein FliF [Seohaeicola zhoushanensis]GHF36091.1 flagellar M-ring protein [Seohaeicola zhoushanensis]